MARFVARRLLYSIPVLLGILFVTFLLARVIPGDPWPRRAWASAPPTRSADAYMERKPQRADLHPVRHLHQGRLHRRPGRVLPLRPAVTTMLVERLPVTIELSLAALTVAVWWECRRGSSRATSTTRPPTWSRWWGPTSGLDARLLLGPDAPVPLRRRTPRHFPVLTPVGVAGRRSHPGALLRGLAPARLGHLPVRLET